MRIIEQASKKHPKSEIALRAVRDHEGVTGSFLVSSGSIIPGDFSREAKITDFEGSIFRQCPLRRQKNYQVDSE
jgi:hypothetical protein